MCYAYNGKLFSHEEWNTDPCYNMGESRKRVSERSQSLKGLLLHDPIYMKQSELVDPWIQNAGWWLPGAGERSERGEMAGTLIWRTRQ